MKKPASAIFLILFILLFFISLYGLTASISTARELNSKPTITAVVMKYFPPHYSQTKNGAPQGFAIDSIEKIAENAGFKINYLLKDNWTQVSQALKNGEADIIPNIGVTKKRTRDFDFSIAIELSPISIIVRNESKDIKNKSDLKNKITGVIEYNIGLKIAKSLGLTYVSYSQPENALIALLSGQIDAIIYPKRVMQNVAKQSGLEDRIKIIKPTLKILKRAIALNKNNRKLRDKLNKSILQLKNSNDFRNIYIKWYGKEKPSWDMTKVIILSSILVFITILLSAIWRYLSVKKLNKELINNIEEKNKIEEELILKKNLLHNVINSMPDLVWLKDINGTYILCNNKIEALFSTDSRNIIGKTDYDFTNKKIADTLRQKDNNAIKAGKSTSNEEEIKYSSDGHIELVETIKTPIYDSNKELIGVLGIARDITTRKNLEVNLQTKEQEQREILNSMVDAVITVDEKGTILSFNKSAKKLFGYDYKEIIGQSVWLLMNSLDAKRYTEYLELFMSTGKASILGTTREASGKRKDDTTFPMRLSVALLPADASGKKRFIGSCQDLTTYKQQEEQLRQTQKMDALGKLTGGIAHDFNNILGVIMGYSELLIKILNKQPDIAKYASEIHHASERGSKLTKKLLSFSRQRTPDTSILNINTFLKDEQHMLGKILTARINLQFNLQENLWTVKIDANDLEDAIINICINAMHAMNSAGDLTITTHNEYLSSIDAHSLQLKAGEYVVLSITDTGCGIEKIHQAHIFDPFYTTKDEHGTGLGLSQVYGFTERSCGNVIVDSEIGKGTIFTLYFPRHKKTAAKNPDEIDNLSQPTNLKGNEVILVVDDEPSLLKLTTEFLKQQGYTVHMAHNATQALEILKKHSIDLLHTDVIMPGMDGYKLAEIVRKDYPKIKIQLASGFTECQQDNINNDVLNISQIQKPFNSQTLLKNIRTLLG